MQVIKFNGKSVAITVAKSEREGIVTVRDV